MGTVKIGELIRERVNASGMSKSEFARRINTTPQNVYGIFKRKSVDTDMLRRIGEVLNYDFFNYYHAPIPVKKISQDPEGIYATKEKLSNCEKNVEELLKTVQYLRKHNESQEIEIQKLKAEIARIKR